MSKDALSPNLVLYRDLQEVERTIRSEGGHENVRRAGATLCMISQKEWCKTGRIVFCIYAGLEVTGGGVGGSTRRDWDAGRCRERSHGWPPQQRAKDVEPGAAD